MLQSLHFMKKIPPGAEAANILVGEVDFLNHPVVTFVRLLHPIILRDLTEVPVPTKFVFILLGPMGNQSKYHEIGRSIATLMSDEVRFLRVHALAEIFPFIVIENRNLCHMKFIEGCNKTRFFYDKQFWDQRYASAIQLSTVSRASFLLYYLKHNGLYCWPRFKSWPSLRKT